MFMLTGAPQLLPTYAMLCGALVAGEDYVPQLRHYFGTISHGFRSSMPLPAPCDMLYLVHFAC